MELAPKPYQNGYARIAYNIFVDMDNQWLSRDELWELMPNAAKADKAARRKLHSALSNGEERGLFAVVGESRGNQTNKKYRIATKDHRDRMMKKYYEKNNKRKVAKAQARVAVIPAKKLLNGANPVLALIEQEIERTEEKLARLERMRNDALTL